MTRVESFRPSSAAATSLSLLADPSRAYAGGVWREWLSLDPPRTLLTPPPTAAATAAAGAAGAASTGPLVTVVAQFADGKPAIVEYR